MATQEQIYRAYAKWQRAVEKYHNAHITPTTAKRYLKAGEKAKAEYMRLKSETGGNRSNPSDSALAGARILGVTRNRAGKVTALKLQLKAGAGGGGRSRGVHSNPIVRASDVGPYAYQTKTSLSGGWRTIGRAKTIKAATTQARANAKYDRAPARVMHYANGTVYGEWDSSGKKIAGGGAKRSNPSAGAGGDKIPGIAKWDTFGGGTFAAAGKHSYSFNTGAGKYSISPISWPNGRHRGYLLSVWAAPGHYGHHQIGKMHASPARAVAAARTFQAQL